MRITALALLAALGPAAAAAQQSNVDGHANYQRTTVSHQTSWGAGATYGLTFGGQNAPVKLNSTVGGDYTKQESGDQKQLSASFDATLQLSAGPLLTPYAGGSVSANWLDGSGMKFGDGAKLGLQYIIGTQLKFQKDAPYSLVADVRPGYVRGQQHSNTVRFGVQFSM